MNLCLTDGYIYALVWICLRDDVIIYKDEMQVSDMESLFSPDRIIRTEMSTLAGLMLKGEIRLECPSNNDLMELVNKTDALLKELHDVFKIELSADDIKTGLESVIQKESFYREAFFYSGETAYYFQFRDLAYRKYENDSEWFKETKLFSVTDADIVIKSICSIQQNKIANLQKIFSETGVDSEDLLNLYTFTVDDVVNDTGLDDGVVSRVINNFSLTGPTNAGFVRLNDFNEYNASPLISLSDNKYLILQTYSIAEAFYESPYYWMLCDKSYLDAAMENRGNFTEVYSAERLENVFGKDRVFTNVNIIDSKKNIAGEIDVLVVFSDRAIVLQAKSKKLTLESRKGNDKKIKDDFKKSVQDSYDQGYLCATLIKDGQHTLQDSDKNNIFTDKAFSQIYIFCVVLDSYPALSFQARQFLKYKSDDIIQPPFVMDVFLLDVLTEMLASPLRFLSYANTRVNYIEQVSSTHELTVLSYHLRRNLYINSEVDYIYLHDDISSSLDLAMMVRREGISGSDTPDGILTRFKGTTIIKLIEVIESEENEVVINLGLLLLSASEEAITEINKGLDVIIKSSIKDGGNHDFGVGIAGAGVTFHCNNSPIREAQDKLAAHCVLKKYSEKSDEWFGVLLKPEKETKVRFGVQLKEKWMQSSEMDNLVENLFLNKPVTAHQKTSSKNKSKSNKKYKRKISKQSKMRNRN
ncbi:MAG: NERD domain-containing protein [Pseudomonadota bacterium]